MSGVIEPLLDVEVDVLSHLLSRRPGLITLMWPVVAQIGEAGHTSLAALIHRMGMQQVVLDGSMAR